MLQEKDSIEQIGTYFYVNNGKFSLQVIEAAKIFMLTGIGLYYEGELDCQ